MKKLVLTAAIVLGFVMGSYAQSYFQDKKNGGGLFARGEYEQEMRDDGSGIYLPGHGIFTNWDAENPNAEAPLGGGALLLIGFGAAYAMSKKNKKD